MILEGLDVKIQMFQDSQAQIDRHTWQSIHATTQECCCRPLVVPEASDVEIHIPFDSRASARVSFDGRNTCRMARGSVVK